MVCWNKVRRIYWIQGIFPASFLVAISGMFAFGVLHCDGVVALDVWTVSAEMSSLNGAFGLHKDFYQ